MLYITNLLHRAFYSEDLPGIAARKKSIEELPAELKKKLHDVLSHEAIAKETKLEGKKLKAFNIAYDWLLDPEGQILNFAAYFKEKQSICLVWIWLFPWRKFRYF